MATPAGMATTATTRWTWNQRRLGSGRCANCQLCVHMPIRNICRGATSMAMPMTTQTAPITARGQVAELPCPPLDPRATSCSRAIACVPPLPRMPTTPLSHNRYMVMWGSGGRRDHQLALALPGREGGEGVGRALQREGRPDERPQRARRHHGDELLQLGPRPHRRAEDAGVPPED